MREHYVAVVGPSAGSPAEHVVADEVGKLIAKAGASGCIEAGGKAVGILPTETRLEANPYLTIAVATGMGEARNAIVVRTADVVIAINGEYGTLSEIALALKMGKPVVGLGTWELAKDGKPVEAIVRARDAADAVAKAIALIG